MDYENVNKTDDNGNNGTEEEKGDDGVNSIEEEARDEDVEENKIIVVDPEAWMDDATTPLNSTTEEDEMREQITMDATIPDKTPIPNVNETTVTEPEDVAAQMEAKYGKLNGP